MGGPSPIPQISKVLPRSPVSSWRIAAVAGADAGLRGETMTGRYSVLFLCTGNSARSIMAEAIMNKKGFPAFTAYSAGSRPKGSVHPAAIHQIEVARLPTTGLRSKDWSEFAKARCAEVGLRVYGLR